DFASRQPGTCADGKQSLHYSMSGHSATTNGDEAMTPNEPAGVARAEPAIPPDLPPDADLREQVLRNQTRTAIEWSETTGDLAVNNIVNEREAVPRTRW